MLEAEFNRQSSRPGVELLGGFSLLVFALGGRKVGVGSTYEKIRLARAIGIGRAKLCKVWCSGR